MGTMAFKNVSQPRFSRRGLSHSGGAVPDSHRSSLFCRPRNLLWANHQHTINTTGNLPRREEVVKWPWVRARRPAKSESGKYHAETQRQQSYKRNGGEWLFYLKTSLVYGREHLAILIPYFFLRLCVSARDFAILLGSASGYLQSRFWQVS